MREGLILNWLPVALYIALVWFIPLNAQAQIGNIISSVGAINQSMGGTATAMPLDASGSQYWNPAGITDLEETELDINIQPFFVHTQLSTFIEADALAPGVPPTDLSSTLQNRARVSGAPSIGFVKTYKNSPWRWGILTTGVGGASANYPKDSENLVTADPPNGFGHVKIVGASAQVSPTVAYKITPHLSVGIQPNFNIASIKAEPFAGAPPQDNDGDGIFRYPKGNKAWTVGIGIQGGIYYHRKGVHLGAAVKSPQLFLPFHPIVTYENGQVRHAVSQTNLPLIASIGVGYSGIRRLKLAVDARYADFGNTNGYDQVGFNTSGSVKGPGWKSVWLVASGVQYELTEKCSLRAGYAYSSSPIKPVNTAFSVSSASITRNQLSFGISYQYRPRFTLAAAYLHDFAGGATQGPLQSPQGPIPNTFIKLRTGVDSFVISLLFKLK